jgi:hypothetical protein
VDNGVIHDEMLALFRDVFAGRYAFEMPGLPLAAAEKETKHA